MTTPAFKNVVPRWVVVFAVVFCLTLPALAAPRQFELVDQAVEDLDLLAISLRQIPRGLSLEGEHTRLYRAPQGTDPWNRPVYYRLEQGFTMRAHQLDYLVIRGNDRRPQFRLNIAPRRDGEFVEVFGNELIFELRPLDQLLPPESMPLPPNSPLAGQRVDARVSAIERYRLDPKQIHYDRINHPQTSKVSNQPSPDTFVFRNDVRLRRQSEISTPTRSDARRTQ